MDALEFAKAKRRICTYYKHNGGCTNCVLGSTSKCFIGHTRNSFENDMATIVAVEKWAKEHPEKTRQSEFLKTFPQAPLNKRLCLQIKPCEIDHVYTFNLLKDSNVNCLKQTCDYCRAKYWLAPLEDTNE